MNLVADIGGTNIRFAVTEIGSSLLKNILVFPCADFADLSESIHSYLERFSLKNISKICLAVPGPVDFDHIELPNSHWIVDRKILQQTFDAKISIVNDYSAQLLSLDLLDDKELLWIGDPKPEQVHSRRAHANLSYMNPSTPRRSGLKSITFLIIWWAYVRPCA